MEFLHWLQENWFDLLQTAAIVAGFVAMNRDKRKEKIQNRIYFTARHAELSRREVTDARLSRINQPVADLKAVPITAYEENHIREKFHNFAATFYAEKNGAYAQPAALAEDIRGYFALPIPRAVWGNMRTFLDPDFIAFVEGHLLEPVLNFLRELSVLCKYIPALRLGWRSKEKRIRVMSAMKNGLFAPRT